MTPGSADSTGMPPARLATTLGIPYEGVVAALAFLHKNDLVTRTRDGAYQAASLGPRKRRGRR